MFFHDFLRDWIADSMQDPKERDLIWEAHTREQLAGAEKL